MTEAGRIMALGFLLIITILLGLMIPYSNENGDDTFSVIGLESLYTICVIALCYLFFR